MGVRRSLARLAGLSAAPVLILTACGDTSSSIADPPISSAPQSSDPTTNPAHESPEHFIRRWAEAEKRMENTGKTTAYLALSRGCTSCQKLAAEVAQFYIAGGFIKWSGWRIVSIRSHQGVTPAFEVRIVSGSTTYRKSAHGATQHLNGGPSVELLTLGRTSGQWNVRSTAELAS